MPRCCWPGATLIVLLLLFFPACQQAPHVIIDQFFAFTSDGTLKQVERPESSDPVAALPWPAQTRVTDFCVLSGRIFFTVNGRGLAALATDTDPVAIRSYYEPAFFAGRTSTILVPIDRSLVCHVYVDTGFSQPPVSPDNHGARPVFLQFDGDNDAARFTPLFSRLRTGELKSEAVIAKQLDGDRIALQWKTQSDDETTFSYSSFDLRNGAELEWDSGWFQDNFSVGDVADLDTQSPLSILIHEIMSSENEPKTAEQNIYFFTVIDSQISGEFHYYARQGVQKTSRTTYNSVHIVGFHDDWTAFSPEGRIMRKSGKEVLSIERLPRLPAGYVYTAFGETQKVFCAAWEQVDFYQVARAGILVRVK